MPSDPHGVTVGGVPPRLTGGSKTASPPGGSASPSGVSFANLMTRDRWIEVGRILFAINSSRLRSVRDASGDKRLLLGLQYTDLHHTNQTVSHLYV